MFRFAFAVGLMLTGVFGSADTESTPARVAVSDIRVFYRVQAESRCDPSSLGPLRIHLSVTNGESTLESGFFQPRSTPSVLIEGTHEVRFDSVSFVRTGG